MIFFAKLTVPTIQNLHTGLPISERLYAWLLSREKQGKAQEFEFADFQAFCVASGRKPYSEKQIGRGLKQLFEFGLVEEIKRYNSRCFKVIAYWQKNEPQKPDGAASKTDKMGAIATETSKRQAVNADALVPNKRERSTDQQTAQIVFAQQERLGQLEATIDAEQTEIPEHLEESQCENSLLREIREIAPLNPTLKVLVVETMAKYGAEAVRRIQNAIAAVKQQREKPNVNISNPCGQLYRAIQQGWTPNRARRQAGSAAVKAVESSVTVSAHDPDTSESIVNPKPLPEGFLQWFALAQRLGVAIASSANPNLTGFGDELAVYTEKGWQAWEYLSRVFPLAELQERARIAALAGS